MKKKLFTRDFSIFIAGSVVCCVADVAMSFLMSIIVYDETSSTILSGIFFSASFLPNIIVPLFCSPWIDRNYKKQIMVGCDLIIGLMYLLGCFVFSKTGFNYILFMVFDLICGFVGGIYQVAYTAYFPCLLDEKNYQKGYTIFEMIYPICSVVFSPISAYLYKIFGLTRLMLIIGIGMLLVTLFDLSLTEKGNKKNETKSSFIELKEASEYLRKEEGLNNWYWERAIDTGFSSIKSMLIVAYFETNPLLGIERYSLLSAAEFLGRTITSFLNFKIVFKHKIELTIFVYLLYAGCDSLLLFLPYPLILVSRMICGGLGALTFVLRESAVMKYIPEQDRGKITSLLNLKGFVFSSICSLIGGYIGDILGLRTTMVLVGVLAWIVIWWFVIRKRDKIKKIFDYQDK